jgi:cytochrome c biogenesis protein CcdA
MRGVAALSASVFLLLYGLKMLNLIPGLCHFTLRLPKAFTRHVNSNLQTQRSPLMIDVLTGFLLGCGPLPCILWLLVRVILKRTQHCYFFRPGNVSATTRLWLFRQFNVSQYDS